MRWLAGGWSSHFEHARDGLRLRTDFVTRPPRLSAAQLDALWRDAEAAASDVVAPEPLALMKMTARKKDYAVIGELARRMADPRVALRFSRSSRDLMELAAEHPDALADAIGTRPLLAGIAGGRDALDEAFDRERRALMRADEARWGRYCAAAETWASVWRDVSREIASLPLHEAHRVVTRRAEGALPFVLRA